MSVTGFVTQYGATRFAARSCDRSRSSPPVCRRCCRPPFSREAATYFPGTCGKKYGSSTMYDLVRPGCACADAPPRHPAPSRDRLCRDRGFGRAVFRLHDVLLPRGHLAALRRRGEAEFLRRGQLEIRFILRDRPNRFRRFRVGFDDENRPVLDLRDRQDEFGASVFASTG